MSAKQLRAFIFDPAHADEQKFVKSIFSALDEGSAISIINGRLPKVELERSIIACDPTEIVWPDYKIDKRTAAIVENPNLTTVCFTSGTTGKPKPVEHSSQAIESSVDSLYKISELQDNIDWLCVLPPYFVAGLSIFLRTYLKGGDLIFHNHFEPSRIQEEIERGFSGCISLVPNQLKALIDNKVELSKLHTVLVGGGHFDDDLKAIAKDLGINFHSTYGMTETFGGICHDGFIFDNTEVRILNDEVMIKSESLFDCYRHDAISTIDRFEDGWYKTNDRGALQNGLLTILGRTDDVINSGGIKIDPKIIEEKLAEIIPDFIGFIGGTEHEILGQCCTLFVTSDNLNLEILREQLSRKIPRTHLPVRIAVIDELKYTDSGKLNRKQTTANFLITQQHEVK